jgi:hypothetical protein
LAVGQRFGVRFDEFHNDSTTISLKFDEPLASLSLRHRHLA